MKLHTNLLVDFILRHRGTTDFVGWNVLEIAAYINDKNKNRESRFVYTADGNITGIVFATLLSIDTMHVEHIVTRPGSSATLTMLRELKRCYPRVKWVSGLRKMDKLKQYEVERLIKFYE